MISRELREPDYWINRAEKAEAALAKCEADNEGLRHDAERYHLMCNTLWEKVSATGDEDCARIAVNRITELEGKLAECEREKELSQQGLCDYNKHRLLDNEERFCYWRDKIVPKMQEQIADLSRKLAAAREVINAAQQSIEFSNHVTSVKCWHCTKRSKLREALAALTEAGEGEK